MIQLYISGLCCLASTDRSSNSFDELHELHTFERKMDERRDLKRESYKGTFLKVINTMFGGDGPKFGLRRLWPKHSAELFGTIRFGNVTLFDVAESNSTELRRDIRCLFSHSH